MKLNLKPPGGMLLRPTCDDPLSNVAFNFNLRRYTQAAASNLKQSALPVLLQGDVFRVTIDATVRTLTIQRRVPIVESSEMTDATRHVHTWEPAICMQLNDIANGTRGASSTAAGGQAPPLALTVSLKYASDECHLIARD
jgi:hypothetical protein